MSYLTPFIKLYGKSSIYPNNDGVVFTQLTIWSSFAGHFFAPSFESAIVALDESGITNYLEARADFCYQTDILQDVRRKREVMMSLNLMGFAENSLSNKLTRSDGQVVQGEKCIRGAKIADFMAVWLTCVYLFSMCLMAFAVERFLQHDT